MVGFQSFLHAANGKACSPVGTFGTSRRKNDLRTSCGCDSFYQCSDNLNELKSSKGVWRTEKRFTPLVDDASPGPIYKIPEDLSKQRGLSWGKPPMRSPSATLPDIRSDSQSKSIAAADGSASQQQKPKQKVVNGKPVSTFGTPHQGAIKALPSVTSETATSIVATVGAPRSHIPTYKGRWGAPPVKQAIDEEEEKRKRAKDLELLNILKQGFIQQQAYRSSTPSFSMGSRASIPPPRSGTPGPATYNPAKFNTYGRPEGPTFARTAHNILQFQAGQDSPGPALYGEMRYPQ
eukprot:GILI01016633.1.p1 GENE.GILI01016633.1~~GILI01016633.1.p1  ORF type:complete len:292 (+),score=40.84 GILI01016633.1:33-908(+)